MLASAMLMQRIRFAGNHPAYSCSALVDWKYRRLDEHASFCQNYAATTAASMFNALQLQDSYSSSPSPATSRWNKMLGIDQTPVSGLKARGERRRRDMPSRSLSQWIQSRSDNAEIQPCKTNCGTVPLVLQEKKRRRSPANESNTDSDIRLHCSSSYQIRSLPDGGDEERWQACRQDTRWPHRG
jgi:hypothetical protein